MKSSSNVIKYDSGSNSHSVWLPPDINLQFEAIKSEVNKPYGLINQRESTTSSTNHQPQTPFTIHGDDGDRGHYSSLDSMHGMVYSWNPQPIISQVESHVKVCNSISDVSLEIEKREAQKIIDLANEQASAIIQKAGEQAVQITYQAYKDGFAQGKERAEEEAKQLLQMAQRVLEEAYLWRQEVLAKSEHAVIDLVKDIAVKMFGEGVALDPVILKRVFERSLSVAKTLGNLRIHVHPEDLSMLEPIWLENQKALIGQQMEFVPDESILRGGCFIEGQFGNVDARIETQMKVILDKLTEVSTASMENGR